MAQIPEDRIIYCDDSILVMNKPAGLPTLVDGYDPQAPYLLDVLRQDFDPLWVVHRLDRFTSGVILFARSSEAHRSLNSQFENRKTVKVYHALVNGSPPWTGKSVELPLRPNGDRRHRTVVDRRLGKTSITDLSVLERFNRYTLIEARPRTGRRHQIRAHLAAEGHPIVADFLYGGGTGILISEVNPGKKVEISSEDSLINRLALHARSITISHPIQGETLRFEAPYEADISRTLDHLRNSPELR